MHRLSTDCQMHLLFSRPVIISFRGPGFPAPSVRHRPRSEYLLSRMGAGHGLIWGMCPAARWPVSAVGAACAGHFGGVRWNSPKLRFDASLPLWGANWHKPKIKIPPCGGIYFRLQDSAGIKTTSLSRRNLGDENARNPRIPGIFGFVIPLGFEPKTHSLEGCCSIQLSYGTEPGAKRTK